MPGRRRAASRSSSPRSSTTCRASRACGPTSRAPAAASAPEAPARASSRPTGASSARRSRRCKADLAEVKRQRATAARKRDRNEVATRRPGRLHERRQEHAPQRPGRCGRLRGRHALRHPRPDEPPGRAADRAPWSSSPTRSGSSTSCPTTSSTPSAPRSRRSCAPTSCSRWWTPPIRTSSASRPPCRSVLDELGAGDEAAHHGLQQDRPPPGTMPARRLADASRLRSSAP